MRDPRGGSGLHLQLTGDGAWPDLVGKHIEAPKDIHMAALPHGTLEGRASVAIRFDRKNGAVIVGQLTLRELHGALKAIIAAYGEDWMKPESDDMVERLTFALRETLAQLGEAKRRLGEQMIFDMRASDAAYEEYKRTGQLPKMG